MSKTVKVTCPHCDASLIVDVAAGVVVSHSVPERPRDKVDLNTRLKQMEAEKARSADRLAEAMRHEKDKGRLMEDRFRELMDKAKGDDGSRPVRDIDLD
ncbi:MAG TPA: hypothetical protein VLB51_14515 [Methylomirabilota bacterium]|nr:hypothetical protein [Methylomirabilota bacterium]